jgi:hypothetical protein
MPITIDDNIAEIFKIYDELTQKYLKELEGYKVFIQAVEEMIDQKEKKLQGIKCKTLALLKEDVHFPEITALEKASLIIVYGNIDHTGIEKT